jgi:hypothetical protein
MFDREQKLLAWIYAIARYRMIDRWRGTGTRGLDLPIEDFEYALSAEETEAAKPNRLYRRMALALTIGLVLGLLMVRLSMGFRPDIGVAALIVTVKTGFSALIATFAGGLALRLAKPIGGAKRTIRRLATPLVLVMASAVAIGLVTLIAA